MTATVPVAPLADEREEPTPSSSHHLRAGLLDASVVTALTAAVLAVVMRLSEASFKVPFSYPGPWSREFFAGDATFHLMVARALEQGRWWSDPQPALGAPLGQDLRDFPLGPDHLHLVLIKGLVELLSDPFAAVNAYYLLGYLLVALSGWAVLRVMGISRAVSVVVAVLIAFLPYHAGKGPEHLFLANYATVPLAVLLLHWHLTGRTAWGPARTAGGTALTGRRLVAVLVIAVLLGSSSAYYALYFLLLLGLVTVFQVLAQRDWRPALSAALLGVPVLATLLLNALPALLFTAENGPNTALGRVPYQSTFFGLVPSQLLVPIEGHRLDALSRVSDAQRLGSGWQEPGHSLGLLGTLTVLALAVVLVRRVAHGRQVDGPRARLRERSAALSVLAVLVATSGGGSLLLALLGFGQARVWARMSIFIAVLVLCALATWLDDGLDALRARGAQWAWAAWPALAAVLAFGILDQTTPNDVPAYRPVQVAFDSDYAFMRSAHTLLGDGGMVWQLPQVAFPEGGLRFGAMYDYDLFKGYLHAPELRWSYGAVKGRPAAQWQVPVSRQPLDQQLPLVAAVGFDAVYVDTFGPDAGRSVEQIEDLLGVAPLRSADGRLVLFDLRPLAEQLRRAVGPATVDVARADLLGQGLRAEFAAGFLSAGDTDLNGRGMAGPTGELRLVNPRSTPAEVEVEMLLTNSVEQRSQNLRVERPGALDRIELIGPSRTYRTRLVLPPGETFLRLSTDVPPLPDDRRALSVQDVRVIGPDLTSVLQACAPRPGTPSLRC